MIGVRLAELLEERGKSRYWLGKTTGLTPQTISKLFNSETTKIEFSTMNAICKAFDCQPSEFLVYVKEEEKKESEPKNKSKRASSKH